MAVMPRRSCCDANVDFAKGIGGLRRRGDAASSDADEPYETAKGGSPRPMPPLAEAGYGRADDILAEAVELLLIAAIRRRLANAGLATMSAIVTGRTRLRTVAVTEAIRTEAAGSAGWASTCCNAIRKDGERCGRVAAVVVGASGGG